MCLKYMVGPTVLLGVVLFAQAAPSSLWDIDDARNPVKLEIAVDKSGQATEIEFHIDPGTVSAAVRAAMGRLHPRGPFTAAERERNDGVLYFELSREVGGFEVEAMFTPAGELHSEEITVAADKVAPAVRAALAKALPQGTVTAWEEIRNGARALLESREGRQHRQALEGHADDHGCDHGLRARDPRGDRGPDSAALGRSGPEGPGHRTFGGSVCSAPSVRRIPSRARRRNPEAGSRSVRE